MEHGQSGFMVKIQRDGTLAPIGQSHRQVDAVAVGADTLRRQPSIGVALEAFNANDVGTPVGQ